MLVCSIWTFSGRCERYSIATIEPDAVAKLRELNGKAYQVKGTHYFKLHPLE